MTKKWISIPQIEGKASRQAHVDLPEGTFEQEIGRDGFFGPATHLYHSRPPTGWIDWDGPLRPRAFDTNRLELPHGSPWDAELLLSNHDLKFRTWRCTEAMDHLVRNADGDELVFIHKGAGEIYCDFGRLEFRDGDYILLPRGTAWRVEPAAPITALLFEASNDSFRLPDKGLLGNHAIFDPAILETPHIDDSFLAQQGDSMWCIRVKRRDRISTVTFPYNPLDAIGWKGDLAPVRLNWRDIRPIMSHRYHVPPLAHTTFLTDRVIICTFVPRPFETDPGALKVPFFHSNVDFDEVNFLHCGKFFSRDHIRPGMFFFHPSGFPHGPHPKALEDVLTPKTEGTNEVAVTLETRKALDVSTQAERIEWNGYVDSWRASDRRDAAE